MNDCLALRFAEYIDKRFEFGDKVAELRDSRKEPQIPTGTIFLSGFFSLAFRCRSLHNAEPLFRIPGRLDPLIGKRKPSVDRIGDVFALIPPETVRSILTGCVHRLGRNKALKSPWLTCWGVVDGHEFFPGESRHCTACRERVVERAGKKVTLYYHVGVVFYLIVDGFTVALDVEMLFPHEGELDAALRLLPRVFTNHGRILDGVIGDAEYFCAPFFNLCTEHGKYAAAVLKDNNPALLAEARSLMAQIEPTVQEGPAGRTFYWDIEGLSINDKMKKPVRVLRAFEPARLPIRKRQKKQPEPEPHDNWWGTTAPKPALPTRQFAQLGHHRWDIENCVFNILVNQWGLDHCYKHDPAAIQNFILTIFIAYLLVQCFRSRNLKPELRRLFTTIIAIADELRTSLAAATGRAPWVECASLPPP